RRKGRPVRSKASWFSSLVGMMAGLRGRRKAALPPSPEGGGFEQLEAQAWAPDASEVTGDSATLEAYDSSDAALTGLDWGLSHTESSEPWALQDIHPAVGTPEPHDPVSFQVRFEESATAHREGRSPPPLPESWLSNGPAEVWVQGQARKAQTPDSDSTHARAPEVVSWDDMRQLPRAAA
ncbi:MAG TPA: hypothetical protein VEY30_09665, partial [Myxococcaceae bacterium]|nr:hypothetical protein [Myxococcaceae bacterium]